MTFDGRVEQGLSANTNMNEKHSIIKTSEIERLHRQNSRLSEALTEAIEELDSLVQKETMSRTKWSQHCKWMEWLRGALEEAEG